MHRRAVDIRRFVARAAIQMRPNTWRIGDLVRRIGELEQSEVLAVGILN
jgi:hypothetical protein